METLPKWLQSSHNPKKVSMAIKGVGATLISFLPLLALLGIPIQEVDLATLVNSLTTITDNIFILINQFVVVCSLAVAFWGLLRKFWSPKKI